MLLTYRVMAIPMVLAWLARRGLYSQGVFGRREEDQNRQVLCNGVKVVFRASRDVDQRSSFDRPVLGRDTDLPTAADHVVHLILGVRLLWISRTNRQEI